MVKDRKELIFPVEGILRINIFMKRRIFENARSLLRWTGLHWVNGSPVYWAWQRQMPWWWETWHSALNPHKPGHGSLHLMLMQPRFEGHSEFWTHSGRHCGGVPMKPWTHEQTGWLFASLHCELGPHGVGWQGFTGSSIIGRPKNGLTCN